VYEGVQGRPGGDHSAEFEAAGAGEAEPGGGAEDAVGGAGDEDRELDPVPAHRGQAAAGEREEAVRPGGGLLHFLI
jgi:hypothetical protein